MAEQAAAEHSGGTVGKALDILDIFAQEARPLRFSDLLGLSPHPKATLYRLLQTLTSQGMLSYDRDRQTYALGMRLVRLAHAAWRQSALAPVARPFLDALAAEVHETVHLAQMDNGQVLYVDKRNAADPIEMFSQAGKVGPGYCSGVGKAIMAHMEPADREMALMRQAYTRHTDATLCCADSLRAELDQIAQTGVAYDREEHERGIICIAAPILSGMRRRVVGGVSVTTSLQRHSLAELETFRPALLACAAQIGTAAAQWQFPT